MDGWREGLEKDEQCSRCKLPLEPRRNREYRIEGKPVCLMCYDIRDAISENEWMQKQQDEYETAKKRTDSLKPGGEYMR